MGYPDNIAYMEEMIKKHFNRKILCKGITCET
jgi:hypothetical protein